MKIVDKLIEWWASKDKEKFDDDVKDMIKRRYQVEEKDWNRFSEEDKEYFRNFYKEEITR